MEKKMTKKDALNFVLANCELPKEVQEKIEGMIVQLDKKNSAERKPTATQTANENFKEAILDNMEIGKKYTITDLMKSVPEIAELSNQRVSALVRQLKDAGLVERTEEKRKAYFSKVE